MKLSHYILAAGCMTLGLVSSCKPAQPRTSKNYLMSEETIKKNWPDAVTTESGLKYVITEKGDGGATPSKGSSIVAHYTGKLIDGSVFDSSVERNEPFATAIGVGSVIKGWDEAFQQMTKGEKRTLIIPPELGYGAAGYPGVIPENATLIFEVELISFQ